MADDRVRGVFEAVMARDAVLLSEILENMNSSETTSVLAVDHFSATDSSVPGVTSLIAAIKNGDLNCVKVLLKYKADIEGLGVYCDEKIRQNCCTPLFCAAANGNLDILSCLIENGADINACTEDNHTPLMIAIAKGHLDVITFLVQHGANLDAQNKFGETALHLALCRYPDKRWDDFPTFLYNHRKHTPDHCPALLVASECGEVNLATFLTEHSANVTVKDNFGATALHYAVFHQDSLQVLSCLMKSGADVNACTNDNWTPLMIAARCGQVDTVTFLTERGAHVDLQDKDGKTALHRHYDGYNVEVLSCLIKNGADVNACGNDGCTVLIDALFRSFKNFDTVATFLIEHGADIDHQDKNGDTALHFAVSIHGGEFVDKLLALGASHLSNNVGLTPLLRASTNGSDDVVEHLIQRSEITKEQKIDALELLGASLIVMYEMYNGPIMFEFEENMQDAFKYLKQGMELRFANPSRPLLKQPMEPVKAYGNRKESQTLEELGQIEGDLDAFIMESLIIRERILGKGNTELLEQIRQVALYMHDFRYHSYMYDPLRSMELYRRAVELAQSSNQKAINDLCKISHLLVGKFQMRNHLKQTDVLELLEQTVLEYEKQQNGLRKRMDDSFQLADEPYWKLFDLLVQLLSFIPRFCEEGKISVLALLRKLNRHYPRSYELGDTLLHRVIRWYTDDSEIETVKLLLNAGFNVNAVNRDRDTPLHLAVTFKPSNDRIHVLTEMLELLLDGGAHHDFVNSKGETPMDMARTGEARMILSERKKLELKCISARAVKKFRIPYFGVVPQTVEKYIKMH